MTTLGGIFVQFIVGTSDAIKAVTDVVTRYIGMYNDKLTLTLRYGECWQIDSN